MRSRTNSAERVIGRIATAAHGIVTRRELTAAGVTRAEIQHRLATGALLREYPGVYRVGHRAPNIRARYAAAAKACGEGAHLSGLAAAYLWGLLRHGAAPPPEVTGPAQRRVRGLRTRRSRLHPDERSRREGIPVTSVARTLVDIARLLGRDELARACHEAAVKHRTTPSHVDAVLARRPHVPGVGKLRSILHGDTRVTLSRLEKRFLELLGRAGLALPETNRRVGGRRVDCRWAVPPLTVELDSYRYHSSRHAWEQDRRREREARARGDDFRRFTWADVFEDSAPMLRELRGVLPRVVRS